MKIDNGASYLFANQRAQAATTTNRADGPTSFATALAGKIRDANAGSSDVQQADFTSMTRQEMRDWINGQIRSGQMSLEDSSPFMAMTMKVSAVTGQPVDSAFDTTRIDFMKKARAGVRGALSRNNPEAARSLESALEIMLSNQRPTIGVEHRKSQ